MPQHRWTKGNGPRTKFKSGQSGNPGGRPKTLQDLLEAARALTPQALAALEKALDDPDRAVHAAQVILDRGWGKPPQAIYARIHPDADADGVLRYDFRWADAKTNTFPEENIAPTIDAAADGDEDAVTNGDAEAEDEPEAEAQEVVVVWGDGTRSG